jgi:CRISPR/Cas system-associated exonuclease Cas4 (RecB family)
VEELNGAQRDLLEQLRALPGERPEFDPGLRARLRLELEAALDPLLDRLPEVPLFVSKYRLSEVHGCEVRFLSEDSGFSWSPPAARGAVAHKAIELSMNLRGTADPLDLVDEALDRLQEGDASLADWLQGCDDYDRAEVRSLANDHVAKFLECWPPLKSAWRPVAESRVNADLCDDRIRLAGKVDLTVGRAEGSVAGKVVIDLKTGMFSPHHRDDLRFYALVETLRLGTPPRKVATHYLDTGRIQPEDVTEDVLGAAVARTVEGVARLVELHSDGREPVKRPGPPCRWCGVRDGCTEGQQWLADELSP